MPPKNPAPAERASKSTKDAPLVANPVPKHPVNKSLVLKMILAKLEDSKTCDWYALSQRLAGNGARGGGGGGGGKVGLRGKGKGKGKAKELSGTDLHDLYHNFILPGLKSGRALWQEDDVDLVEEGDGHAHKESQKRRRAITEEDRTASQLLGSEIDAMFDDSEDEVDSEPEEEEPPAKRRRTAKPKAAGLTKVDTITIAKAAQPVTSPLSSPESEAMSDEWNVLRSPVPTRTTKVSRATDQKAAIPLPTPPPLSPKKHVQPKAVIATAAKKTSPKPTAQTKIPRRKMQTKQESFSKNALAALQEVSESYLTSIFENTNAAAQHDKRVTILSEDLRVTRRLGDERSKPRRFWRTGS